MSHKIRIDQLMVMKQLADTRTQAAAMIMAGLVRVGDRVVDKPGLQLPEDSQIHVIQKPHPWVSRAGIKLAH
nr:S4 domain-containing protein [Alphaproteobacteria bacterium]